MSKAEIRSIAEAIFAELLDDSVLTTTIEAHREIKRGQVICGTCGTRCRSHAPLPSAGPSKAASREPSPTKALSRPHGYSVGPEKGTGGGSGVGSGSGRVDSSGNAFFDCLVCGRSITSSRYAPHLASCLGFSGSTRRGASRMAAAKSRLANSERASPSPYLTGDDSDADSTSGTKKRKLLNGSSKRANSPSKPLLKKKLAREQHAGSAPPSRLPPSRLGRPPMSAKAQSASPFPGSRPGSTAPSGPSRPGSHGSRASPLGSQHSQQSRHSGSLSPEKKPPPPSAPAAAALAAASAQAMQRTTSQKSTASHGTAGRKTLPGLGGSQEYAGQVQEESSEGEDDY